MAHAEGRDVEPAVEDRQQHRLEQPEVAAGGRERQLRSAELDAPQPGGTPAEQRLEDGAVHLLRQRVAAGVVEPAEMTCDSLDGDAAADARHHDVVEVELDAGRQAKGDVDLAAHRA